MAWVAPYRETVVADTQRSVAANLFYESMQKHMDWTALALTDSPYEKFRSLFSRAPRNAMIISAVYRGIASDAMFLTHVKDPVEFKRRHNALVEKYKQAIDSEASVGFFPSWGPKIKETNERAVHGIPQILVRHPRLGQVISTFHYEDSLAPTPVADLEATAHAWRWQGDFYKGASIFTAVSGCILVPWQFWKSSWLSIRPALAFSAFIGTSAFLHSKVAPCYTASAELQKISAQEGQVLLTLAEDISAGTELELKNKAFYHLNRNIQDQKHKLAKSLPKAGIFGSSHPSFSMYFLEGAARTKLDISKVGYYGEWRKDMRPIDGMMGHFMYLTGQVPKKAPAVVSTRVPTSSEDAVQLFLGKTPEGARQALAAKEGQKA